MDDAAPGEVWRGIQSAASGSAVDELQGGLNLLVVNDVRAEGINDDQWKVGGESGQLIIEQGVDGIHTADGETGCPERLRTHQNSVCERQRTRKDGGSYDRFASIERIANGCRTC